LEEFFEENDQQDSIAPNQWYLDDPNVRPILEQIYQRLKELEQRDDVAWVRVELHEKTLWIHDDGSMAYPDGSVGESIVICTTAPREDREHAMNTGLARMESLGGFEYEVSRIPEIPTGFRVVTLVRD
jgi:hypothetical protein